MRQVGYPIGYEVVREPLCLKEKPEQKFKPFPGDLTPIQFQLKRSSLKLSPEQFSLPLLPDLGILGLEAQKSPLAIQIKTFYKGPFTAHGKGLSPTLTPIKLKKKGIKQSDVSSDVNGYSLKIKKNY